MLLNVNKAAWNMDMSHIAKVNGKQISRRHAMKIKFKDLSMDGEVVTLDIRDIKMMTGDQDETILIENINGGFYKAIVVEFI